MNLEAIHREAMERLHCMRVKKSDHPEGEFEWIPEHEYVLLHLSQETRMGGTVATDVGHLSPLAFRYLVDGGYLVPERFTNMFRLADRERGDSSGNGKKPI